MLVTDIYAAREKDPGDIHATQLVEALQRKGVCATYTKDFDGTEPLSPRPLEAGRRDAKPWLRKHQPAQRADPKERKQRPGLVSDAELFA